VYSRTNLTIKSSREEIMLPFLEDPRYVNGLFVVMVAKTTRAIHGTI